MSFAELVFGWPAILSSLFISLVGITTRHWFLLVAGALLILGFSFYLIGSPLLIFKILGVSIPLLHLAGARMVSRGLITRALLCLVPQIVTTIYFGIIIR